MGKRQRLVDFFVHAIGHGNYARGDVLPSLRELCQVHGVSMTTAKACYHELERLGYVAAHARSGFRVVQDGVAAAEPPASLSFFSDLPAPWGSPLMDASLSDCAELHDAYLRALRHPLPGGNVVDGLDVLRRQVARRYCAQGVLLGWERLLISCGAMEALSLALRACCQVRPGAAVGVALPAFPAALALVEQQGVPLRALPAADEQALLAAAESALQGPPLAALMLMSNYRHPDGLTLSDAAKRRLVELAARHDTPIIEDDSYRELAHDGRVPLPLLAYDRAGLVLSAASFSKTFAPGHRVGWLVPGRYADAVRALKYASTLGSPLPSQQALAEYLADAAADQHLGRLRPALAARVAAMREDVLAAFPPGTEVSRPAGGYLLWCRLPQGHDAAAALPAARADGVHYLPGAHCHPGEARALRLNASGYRRETQQPLLRRLGALLTRR